ncbi:MAG TPA: SusC/RagA family TonB-linked outer membrane protein [Daejeonella sp.]
MGGNFTHSTSIPNGDQGTALFQRNLEQRPYDRPYLPNGSFAVGGKDILRHNGVLILAKDDTFDDNFQGLVNLYGNVNFLKHFTYHSGYNTEIRQGRGFRHQKMEHPYNAKGYTNDIRNNRYSATFDNTLSYKNTWANGLNVDVVAGHSFFQNKYNFNQATGTEFPSDDFQNVTSATIRTADGDASEYAIESYLGRLTLNFKDRYFLSASARYDGSSKFSKANRFATFPSVSGAWAVTNESFINTPDWLEFGKVRLSWGKTGNQDGIGNFSYLPLASGGYNYNLQTGLSVTALGNTDLKWETATQSDLGIDLSFFKGRLGITYDYFIKKTEDLLYNLPVLGTSGFTTRTSNIGSMENRGHELSISSVNIDKRLRWSTSFNISFIRNEVLSLIGEEPITVGGWNAIIPGEALGVFYGYKQLGIYQNLSEIPAQLQGAGVRPGDIIFEDLDKNNIINSSDRQKIGTSQADFSGGLTNSFKFSNFDLSVFNTFSVGSDIAAGWRTGLDHMGASNYGAFKDNYLKRWTGPGTSNTVPRATKSGNNVRNSTYYLEDGSFLRIKNVTLGYQLPVNLIKQLRISQARVFASVNNLYTFTKYSGYDPEASMGLDARSFGVDNLVTPQPRSFMLGLNVNF